MKNNRKDDRFFYQYLDNLSMLRGFLSPFDTSPYQE